MALAVAMILSYIETLIPPLVAVPGIKIGLANIAIIFVLWRVGARQAVAVSAVRIVLSALLFGNFVSLAYSAAGAFLSLVTMTLLKQTKKLSVVSISAVGGVLHNAGQILAAVFLMGSRTIFYYLPPLIISGTLTGLVIGVLAGLLIKRFEKVEFR